jgi:RNA polymerase sigma factor (TIGR02999 family)
LRRTSGSCDNRGKSATSVASAPAAKPHGGGSAAARITAQAGERDGISKARDMGDGDGEVSSDDRPRAGPRGSAELLPLVYAELRRLAARQMRREPRGHTLQATALVHEAYARVAGEGGSTWDGPGHFYAAAAEAMRRILIERARRRARQKHGGAAQRLDADCLDVLSGIGNDAGQADAASVMWVDETLGRLEAMDPRLAELVKLRCFLGMSIAEAAAALGVSSRTLNRDWVVAQAWLRKEWDA